MTYEQAQSLGMRDGVSFQTKNTLIENENGKVKLHYSDKNTGASQRTAVAQRADGTILLLVTDGRSASSIGATKNDVIDLLVEYGAVTAGMLDGGSSSMLYYENYIEKYKVDKSELDNYQFKGLVNRYKAFTAPRRMPAYFIVTKK
ncbi:MAG: phosphodiester glycosidase family protein [Clostridiales bacterium]|nr:phosphodiester glycosidase family protein [Candidatus Equinaster intestinalis]